MSIELSTRDIPAEHLKRAYLINVIPARTLQADPRFTYCLYIPQEHYTPGVDQLRLPLIVNVHGSRRRAEDARNSMKDFADKHKCAVLAPLFPVGIAGDRFDVDNYKAINYKGTRYDLLLLAMVEETGRIWPGVATDTFFLMGYSGGGQFALRFLYLHPKRLEAVSVGAPGSLTTLEEQVPWPKGIGGIGDVIEDAEVKLEDVQKVEFVQVLVGAEDSVPHGNNWKPWLAAALGGGGRKEKKAPGKEKAKAVSRLDEARCLHAMLESYEVKSTLTLVPNVAHDSDACTPYVQTFLEPAMEKWWVGNGSEATQNPAKRVKKE